MYVKTTTDRKTMKSSSCADIAAPGYRNIECKRERETKISRACQRKNPCMLSMTKTKVHVPYYQSFLEL